MKHKIVNHGACRLALAAALFAGGTWAQPAPSEKLVTAQADLYDAEFSQSRNQIVWVDSSGSLWIAQVDPVTGDFVPRNGKGRLIDADAMTGADLQVVGNGPEWVSMAATDHIVYTKFLPNREHTQVNARLGFAFQQNGGQWLTSYLSPELRRNAPYASEESGDLDARISYVDPQGNHYWRSVLDATSETLVPWYPQSFRSMRFVRGARAAVFVSPVAGVDQVFRYFLDTHTVEQLTYDAGDKDLHSVPWMWSAPEYGGEFVLATIVEDIELRIYRDVASAGPGWSAVHAVSTESNGIMNSPEPFVYQGRSYMHFAATMPWAGYPGAIYLTGIDPNDFLFRQLTPTVPTRMRQDPEVYITQSGPQIYFNRFDPKVDPSQRPNCDACSEGVFRTPTGL